MGSRVADSSGAPSPYLLVEDVAERLRCLDANHSRTDAHELDSSPAIARNATLPLPTGRTRGMGERVAVGGYDSARRRTCRHTLVISLLGRHFRLHDELAFKPSRRQLLGLARPGPVEVARQHDR